MKDDLLSKSLDYHNGVINLLDQLPPRRRKAYIVKHYLQHKRALEALDYEMYRWNRFNLLKEECKQKGLCLRTIVRKTGYDPSLVGRAIGGQQCPSQLMLDNVEDYMRRNKL